MSFERLRLPIAATAASLAMLGGCAEEHHPPQTVQQLQEELRPTAENLAALASESGLFHRSDLDEDPSTREIFYMTREFNPESSEYGGYDHISITFKSDDEVLEPHEVYEVDIDVADCEITAEGAECSYGNHITLYAPEVEFDNEKAWGASQEVFFNYEDSKLDGGFQVDTDGDYLKDTNTVGTSRELAEDATSLFDSILASQ